jgi:hypothetical protein
MIAVRCMLVAALLALSVPLAAGSSASPGIAFETVTLKHLTAGELAPLLAPYFQFVGRTLMRAPEPGRGELAGFVPEGVKLITAGNQSSHNLLVAGTARGVAELRSLLSTIDGKPETLHLSVSVYPALLSKAPLGERPGKPIGSRSTEPTEPSVAWLTLKSGQSLSALGMPRGVEPTEVKLDVANGSSEFVPLPAYRGCPQVLLSVMARINADDTVTLTVGAGMLEGTGDPLAAVQQARSSPATTGHMSLRPGEKSVLVISREKVGITVAIEVARDKKR